METFAMGLSLAGSFLTVVGITLTLVGTQKVRTVIQNLIDSIFPKPVTITTGAAAVSVESRVSARGRALPGPAGWTEQEWRDHFHDEIDHLQDRIDSHHHRDTQKAIKALQAEDGRIRTELETRVGELRQQAEESEVWTRWGLGVALLGALLHGTAFVITVV